MTLIPITNHLYQAKREQFAIPLFDAFEMQGAEGIFTAIQTKNAPAIVAVYAPLLEDVNAKAFIHYLQTRAARIKQPISLMLDHGATQEHCEQAIKLGFTDIMFDGSRLSLEENIAATKTIVNLAHQQGIGVEAELGHVGSASEYEQFGSKNLGFTDPTTVSRFVNETGVDFLAIAFGTAHGVFQGQPQLDLELLDLIHQQVTIPLVMHGGSGLSQAQFKAAIAHGITKINISTNLVNEATTSVKKLALLDESDMFDLLTAIKDAYKEQCELIFDLFGTTNKAA